MRKVEKWHYSFNLNRIMNVKIYGHYGVPILVFPCQDKMSDDFENFGMIDTLSSFIESGKIKLICVDSIDRETLSNYWGDKEYRSHMQNQYVKYIIDEVLPIIYDDNKGFTLPYVTGCSMGATQASILFFRRPDLFAGVLGLSGYYEIVSLFDGWVNDNVYNNSPITFLKNMSSNHPYINIYNSKKIIFCMGQGAWENQLAWTFYELRNILNEKNINAWMDIWGYDCSHDWYWWKAQMVYFIPFLIG